MYSKNIHMYVCIYIYCKKNIPENNLTFMLMSCRKELGIEEEKFISYSFWYHLDYFFTIYL